MTILQAVIEHQQRQDSKSQTGTTQSEYPTARLPVWQSLVLSNGSTIENNSSTLPSLSDFMTRKRKESSSPETPTPALCAKKIKQSCQNPPTQDIASIAEQEDREATHYSKQPSRSLGDSATKVLKNWMFAPEHIQYPYPTELEKNLLATAAGISNKQLCNWFVNARKRHWKPLQMRLVKTQYSKEEQKRSVAEAMASAGSRSPCQDVLQQSVTGLKQQSSCHAVKLEPSIRQLPKFFDLGSMLKPMPN
jgi:hypothetical protein